MRAVFVALFCLTSVCNAQKSTELFIPIGKSPGLSAQGKTIQGTVTKVEGSVVTVGDKTVLVSEQTKIFLDRSTVHKTNTYGTKSDIKVGVFVEVFPSEWLKIRTK